MDGASPLMSIGSNDDLARMVVVTSPVGGVASTSVAYTPRPVTTAASAPTVFIFMISPCPVVARDRLHRRGWVGPACRALSQASWSASNELEAGRVPATWMAPSKRRL